MLEGNEVEVCELGGGPKLPVGQQDFRVVTLQVNLDLLVAIQGRIKLFLTSFPQESRGMLLEIIEEKIEKVCKKGEKGREKKKWKPQKLFYLSSRTIKGPGNASS